MKYSLKNSDKLKLKSEFAYVRRNGVKYVSSFFVMLVASAPDRKLRCGVICGKKFSKKAVVRNRARRIFWESFRMLKPEIKPCHVIVIPRMRIQGMRTQDIIPDLSRLLEKAGLTGN